MLTLDNRDTIVESLRSIANLADEIVAVDGGSIDGTVEILRNYGAHILTREFSGFDEERNVGLGLTHGEWILALDADEALPPALESELRILIEEGACDVIYVPRKNYVAGRVMKSLYPDWQPKLYRKGSLTYLGRVHETPSFRHPVTRVFASNALMHYSDRTLTERFAKEVRYWTLGLPGRKSIAKRWLSLPFTIANLPLYLLLKRRFLKDGIHGVTIALLSLAAYCVALNSVTRMKRTGLKVTNTP